MDASNNETPETPETPEKPEKPKKSKKSKKAEKAEKKESGRSGASLKIDSVVVPPGERRRIDIPVATSFGQVESSLPVIVVNGRRPGPRLFVSAAIHGDEINGVEIIRRLLGMSTLRRLRGTLLAIPVVNVYGFTAQSRYLPDRRDLNRSFPGSAKGSLASRLAHVFMTEVVKQCTHGIDLHTGSLHRTNLPQIRAALDDAETSRLAHAFGVPVVLDSNIRDGSLRQAVLERETPVLLYEAGEALRFDEVAIRAGVRGVLSVMRAIDMLPPAKKRSPEAKAVVCSHSKWERAPAGGMLRRRVKLGERVRADQTLGLLADPFGEDQVALKASIEGIVIGHTNLPLVNEGDGVFHIAEFEKSKMVAKQVAAFQAALDPDSTPSPSGEPPAP